MPSILRAIALGVCLSGLSGGLAPAAPMDLLFSTPHLAASPVGSRIVYQQSRRFRDVESNQVAETAHEISLVKNDDDVTVTIDVGGRKRVLDPFVGVPGNPVLMVFLEGVLKSLHDATGGSPFYLRNRLKDGLREALQQEGETGVLTMRPFDTEPNRARLGPFADLVIRFEVVDEVPGMLKSLSARAGSGDNPIYLEEVRFDQAR